MMKKYLMVMSALVAVGLVACKKESKFPIAGKWQETKLTMYLQNVNGFKSYDTTYLQPFSSSDFVQFNNDGTCIIGSAHYYYMNMPDQHNETQEIPPTTSKWNFTPVGSGYVLNTQSTLANPGGFVTADTARVINQNTLLLHSVFYSHDGVHSVVTDSYYTK